MLEADSQGILAVPGHEWAVFRLGLPGSVTEVHVDTNHFKVGDSENVFLALEILSVICSGKLPGQLSD